MKRVSVFLCALLICFVSFPSSAQDDPGVVKKLADHPVRPTRSINAPVADLHSDDYKDQVPAEILNAVIRAYDPTTGKLSRVQMDGSGNLRVIISGAGGVAEKSISATYSPVKTTSATVGTTPVTVLGPLEVLAWPKWCVTLNNADAVDPFVAVELQVRPDDSSVWVPLTWTSCNNLAKGEGCTVCNTDAHRHMRVQVTASDANPVSVAAWFTANQN